MQGYASGLPAGSQSDLGLKVAVIIHLADGPCLASAESSFSSCDDVKAMIVVLSHVVDQIDLPGQVLAHRIFAVLAALTWREEHIVRLVGQAGCPRLERQSCLNPGLRAADKGHHRCGREGL